MVVPLLSSGGGACRKGMVDGVLVLVVTGRIWVAVRWVKRPRLMERVEARRSVPPSGGGGAMVTVMRLVSGSGLGWGGGNFMVI